MPTICPGTNLEICFVGSDSIGGILTIAPTTIFASLGALSGSSQNFSPSPLSYIHPSLTRLPSAKIKEKIM